MEPTNPTQPQPARSGSDVLGILSIVAPFIGMALIGIILGVIGINKAKREGRPTTLSRIGLILSSVFVAIALVGLLLVFLAVPSLQRNGRNTEKKNHVAVIASELESYYANNQYYPADLNSLNSNTNLNDNSSNDYTYVPTPTGCQKCTGYHLEASLEPAGTPPYKLDGGR
jgi:Tfp pilus assembly protein PilE